MLSVPFVRFLPWARVNRLRLTYAQREEMAHLVQVHLEHRLEAKLRAPSVIRRLRGDTESAVSGECADSSDPHAGAAPDTGVHTQPRACCVTRPKPGNGK